MALKLPSPVRRPASKNLKAFKGGLISLTSVIGQPVVNQGGQPIGRLVDLVFRWDSQESYPPLTGLIVKVAGRKVWIAADKMSHLSAERTVLKTAKLDLREFKPRSGEVSLSSEVLDHQLVDVDGARVVRASDLYLALRGVHIRLVGLDVGLKALLRRLGPRAMRLNPAPGVIIDWATIQSFGNQDRALNVKLSAKRQDLRRMRPGELADLLEDLGRDERLELLSSLTPAQAADALEEMEPEELETILRESTPSQIAQYLSIMETDEAADALRDVDPALRQDLLEHMSQNSVAQVAEVLSYDESTAGGFMNTNLLTAKSSDTVKDAQERLIAMRLEVDSLDSIVIVDGRSKFVYDLPLYELLFAKGSDKLEKLIKTPAPVTANASDSVKQVAQLLVDSRRSSLVVLDEHSRPIGRIMADDIVDALLPDYGRFHFPRLWRS